MNEKRKIGLLFAGIMTVMLVFGLVLYAAEKNIPEKALADSGFLSEEIPLDGQDEKTWGTMTLGGQKYDIFHECQTYLLIGTDASGHNSDSAEGCQGSMSDFLLLVVLDKTQERCSFLPINRDTMTEVTLLQNDGTGEATADLQVCTAHWYGGSETRSCENTVQAVSKLLGNVTIDGYYALPMEEIPRLNRLAGGVEVTLLEDFTDTDQQMKKGKKMSLSDTQAWHYIHDRYGVGDEGNLSRMRRQRQYMQAFMEQTGKNVKNDKHKIQTIWQELREKAVTDIPGSRISGLMEDILQSSGKEFYELEGESRVGQALGDGIDHAEFYVDERSRMEILTELYALKKRDGE